MILLSNKLETRHGTDGHKGGISQAERKKL